MTNEDKDELRVRLKAVERQLEGWMWRKREWVSLGDEALNEIASLRMLRTTLRRKLGIW